MNNQQILDDSIFKVGEVLSVDGRKVKIKVDKSKNNSQSRVITPALFLNSSINHLV